MKCVYQRVLHKIDFDIPHTTEGEFPPIKMTPEERKRWEIAQEFSPFWFGEGDTVFLHNLDRLVLLTSQDLDEYRAEVVAITNLATMDFVDGEYHIITAWITNDKTWSYQSYSKPELGKYYSQKYPTAEQAYALTRKDKSED